MELVDATGELRRVTADSDPELFWALRGGGGDFGIVTAMELSLHPAPHVFGGRLLWPIEMAWPVLQAFRAVTCAAPDELTIWAHLFRFPPLPEVPEPFRGGAFVSIDLAYLGIAEEVIPLLEPFLALPACRLNTLGTVPLSELGSIAAEPVDPMPASEMSWLLRDLDEGAVGRLLDVVGARSAAPLAVVQLRHLGGALERASEAEGPAGAVVEPYQLFCLGVPTGPVGAAIEACFTDVRAVLAVDRTERTMFNFLGADDDPSRAFTPGALDRLRELKRRMDPDGVIRSNRPVLRRG